MAAAKPMTKGQILDHLAKKTGQTKKLSGEFLDELVALAHKEAKKTFVLPVALPKEVVTGGGFIFCKLFLFSVFELFF